MNTVGFSSELSCIYERKRLHPNVLFGLLFPCHRNGEQHFKTEIAFNL